MRAPFQRVETLQSCAMCVPNQLTTPEIKQRKVETCRDKLQLKVCCFLNKTVKTPFSTRMHAIVQ